MVNIFVFLRSLYPLQTVFVEGYTVFTLSVRTKEGTYESVSVAFCYAPNFEKVGYILVSACPYVCMCVCVFLFEISS